jgi:hypothetical protein
MGADDVASPGKLLLLESKWQAGLICFSEEAIEWQINKIN